MTIVNLLLVGLGGGAGAVTRFAMNQFIQNRSSLQWPLATLLINISGSFLLGLFIGSSINELVLLLIGTGFLGAYTTFSTLNLEAIQLKLAQRKKEFYLYLLLSYCGGILFAGIGLWIGLWFARY